MAHDLQTRLAQLRELQALGLIDDAEHAEQKRALLEAEIRGKDTRQANLSALSGATSFGGHVSPPLPAAPQTGPLNGPTMFGGSAATSHPLTPAQTGPSATRPAIDGGGEAFPAHLGSYRVLGMVGAGGMGAVVRARHIEEGWAAQQGGDVAIKLIHPHIAASPEFRARFLAEAALGRRVQHAGLVPTWDVIAEGPWLGTVMGFVEGEPLSSRVVVGGLPHGEVLKLLAPIGDTLDYLHQQGIVHRDIKPGNIVVRTDGRPIVLDLGIAKDTLSETNHTRTTVAVGTSAWMAPEQADAKAVSGAADRYALGLIAYALLTGRLPWGEQETEFRVVTNKLTGQLLHLSSVAPIVPPSVAAAVMRMLEVAPEARFESCAAFTAAWTGSTESTAPPEPAQAVGPAVGETSLPAPPDADTASIDPIVLDTPTATEASLPRDSSPEPAPSPAMADKRFLRWALIAGGLGAASVATILVCWVLFFGQATTGRRQGSPATVTSTTAELRPSAREGVPGQPPPTETHASNGQNMLPPPRDATVPPSPQHAKASSSVPKPKASTGARSVEQPPAAAPKREHAKPRPLAAAPNQRDTTSNPQGTKVLIDASPLASRAKTLRDERLSEVRNGLSGDASRAGPESGRAILMSSRASAVTVWVDGKAVGKTPITLELSAGSHQFVIEQPDGSKTTVTRNVAFSGAGTAILRF